MAPLPPGSNGSAVVKVCAHRDMSAQFVWRFWSAWSLIYESECIWQFEWLTSYKSFRFSCECLYTFLIFTSCSLDPITNFVLTLFHEFWIFPISDMYFQYLWNSLSNRMNALLKVSKFQKQFFLFSFAPKWTKLFFDFWPKDLKWVKSKNKGLYHIKYPQIL